MNPLNRNSIYSIKTILLIIILIKSVTSASKKPKSVTIQTNMGSIQLELYWNSAPKTCENFVTLAERKYYDNTIFHRVIDDFMIQGGDPLGTGTGGKSIYGDKFKDEFDSKRHHDKPGTLSMANAGPDTNGSQFFITLAPTMYLDGKHTIFGRVIKGMDVVKKIGKVEVNEDDRPVQDVKILGFKLN